MRSRLDRAGRWTSYREVARAAGVPAGAGAIGTRLLTGAQTPNAWRVLTVRGDGLEGWTPSSPDQPRTASDIRQRLREEAIGLDALVVGSRQAVDHGAVSDGRARCRERSRRCVAGCGYRDGSRSGFSIERARMGRVAVPIWSELHAAPMVSRRGSTRLLWLPDAPLRPPAPLTAKTQACSARFDWGERSATRSQRRVAAPTGRREEHRRADATRFGSLDAGFEVRAHEEPFWRERLATLKAVLRALRRRTGRAAATGGRH